MAGSDSNLNQNIPMDSLGINFHDLLQHYAHSGRTGCFKLHDGSHNGSLYLISGIAAHAECENLVGEIALFELLSWNQPQFYWEEGSSPSSLTISGKIEDLMLKGIQMRMSGELEAAKKSQILYQRTRPILDVSSRFDVNLTIASPEIQPFKYHPETRQIRIGRHPENDLILRDSSVSRRHALLIINRDSILVRDLGSMNGVKINGNLISQGVVQDGAEVHIGDVICRVSIKALPGQPARAGQGMNA
jgi:hypothetical protein